MSAEIGIFQGWKQGDIKMRLNGPPTPPAPKPPPKPTKTQTSVLPTDAAERKTYPIYSGCINYFPDALALIAKRSYEGNQQHHPDKPLHWDRSKSADELDAMIRHIIEGEWDAVAWRGLAHLQREINKGWRPKND
jgi:hypothetical protein